MVYNMSSDGGGPSSLVAKSTPSSDNLLNRFSLFLSTMTHEPGNINNIVSSSGVSGSSGNFPPLYSMLGRPPTQQMLQQQQQQQQMAWYVAANSPHPPSTVNLILARQHMHLRQQQQQQLLAQQQQQTPQVQHQQQSSATQQQQSSQQSLLQPQQHLDSGEQAPAPAAFVTISGEATINVTSSSVPPPSTQITGVSTTAPSGPWVFVTSSASAHNTSLAVAQVNRSNLPTNVRVAPAISTVTSGTTSSLSSRAYVPVSQPLNNLNFNSGSNINLISSSSSSGSILSASGSNNSLNRQQYLLGLGPTESSGTIRTSFDDTNSIASRDGNNASFSTRNISGNIPSTGASSSGISASSALSSSNNDSVNSAGSARTLPAIPRFSIGLQSLSGNYRRDDSSQFAVHRGGNSSSNAGISDQYPFGTNESNVSLSRSQPMLNRARYLRQGRSSTQPYHRNRDHGAHQNRLRARQYRDARRNNARSATSQSNSAAISLGQNGSSSTVEFQQNSSDSDSNPEFSVNPVSVRRNVSSFVVSDEDESSPIPPADDSASD